jgi:dihydrofolate reductase
MKTLIARVFDTSADGVVADDEGEFFDFCRDLPDDPAQIARTRSLYSGADLHLWGRNTYQGAASYFPTATDHPYADLVNAARKVVFSQTLDDPGWAGTVVNRGDLGQEVGRLKQDGTGYLLAHGGFDFWQSLIRLDLIDEFRLTVFPYVVGHGRRLFDCLEKPRRLDLVSSTTFSNGTVELQYRRPR